MIFSTGQLHGRGGRGEGVSTAAWVLKLKIWPPIHHYRLLSVSWIVDKAKKEKVCVSQSRFFQCSRTLVSDFFMVALLLQWTSNEAQEPLNHKPLPDMILGFICRILDLQTRKSKAVWQRKSKQTLWLHFVLMQNPLNMFLMFIITQSVHVTIISLWM